MLKDTIKFFLKGNNGNFISKDYETGKTIILSINVKNKEEGYYYIISALEKEKCIIAYGKKVEFSFPESYKDINLENCKFPNYFCKETIEFFKAKDIYLNNIIVGQTTFYDQRKEYIPFGVYENKH